MTVKMMLLKTVMSMIEIMMMLMLLIKTMMMLMMLLMILQIVEMQLVCVMSYKPVFCRNHAKTAVSRTF